MQRLRLALTPRIAPALVERLLAELRAGAGFISLEGGGGVFCEGLDLDWVLGASADESAALLRRYAELCGAIAGAPCPTVALVDGKATGGGLALAAAADLVIATPGSSFALPEVFAGLIPAVAYPWVARRAGVTRARRLSLGAAPLDAAGALAAGLVDEVAGDLEAALAAHAGRWRRADARALAAIKTLSAGYDLEAAVAAGNALLHSAPTRARLGRIAAGEPPWESEP